MRSDNKSCDPGLLYRQGVALFHGYNYIDALPLFYQAAQAQHPGALRYLGWFYENGYCTHRDLHRAAECYRQASELGDSLASGYLGVLYDSVTRDFPTDYEEAFRLYTLSIAQGGADATTRNNLAVLYMDGRGTPPDPLAAQKLFREAMALGSPIADANYQELRRRLGI